MRRCLAVAALGAVLLAMPAWAQRGGGHGGGFGGHGGFSSHGAMGGMRGPGPGFHSGFAGFGRGGGRPGFGFRGGPHFRVRFGPYRRGFYPWWGWGYGYPWWYGDLGWYDDNGLYAQPYYPSSSYAPEYYPQDEALQAQQAEINRLSNEVDRLREQREAQQRASQPQPKAESTELVFRDKRTEEIQNYAIAGQTLWVLTEQHARKIPLSDLDIPATQKANEDRGVSFQLPR